MTPDPDTVRLDEFHYISFQAAYGDAKKPRYEEKHGWTHPNTPGLAFHHGSRGFMITDLKSGRDAFMPCIEATDAMLYMIRLAEMRDWAQAMTEKERKNLEPKIHELMREYAKTKRQRNPFAA